MPRQYAPNLIYIFADQLRYSSCGYAGDPRARTPNIDALAEESLSFSNAVSGHPVCAPYRASLFTGKYTTSTGMVINELRMNPNHRCIGHVLTKSGYDTAYIGKWHLWANELGNHHDPKNSYTPPMLLYRALTFSAVLAILASSASLHEAVFLSALGDIPIWETRHL